MFINKCCVSPTSYGRLKSHRSDLDKLQRTMNSAARLITGIKKYDHISDALRNLHWLPIECRIKFKILLMVYKSP